VAWIEAVRMIVRIEIESFNILLIWMNDKS